MDKPRFQVNAQLPNGLPNKFTILSSLSYEALKTHLKKLSDLSEISVTYKDEEGDDITLTNEEDFTEAKRALDFRSILSLQLTVKAVPNATPYREPVREIEAPKPQPTPRFSASSKVKKIGYYPQLAEDLGETLHISEPTKSVAMNRNTQTTPDLTNSTSEWTKPFLSTASREITNVLDSLLKSVTAEPAALLKTSSNTLSHVGIVCKICRKTIIGNRYKCGNCSEFDLCELCLLDPEAHDPTHVLLLIRLPCPNAGYVNGLPVPMLKENIYQFTYDSDHKHDTEDKQTTPSPYADKKARKALKQEKKLKKMLPNHIETQVKSLKSEIENRRKEISDIRGKIRDTKRSAFSSSSQETAAPISTSDLSAMIVRDNTDCVTVPPLTRVNYKWLVENNGSSFWSLVRFHCVSGNLLCDERQISLPFCPVGDQIELEVPFTAPETPGYYSSKWRLSHHGIAFGPPFKVECRVSIEQVFSGKNVEVDSGAEDDEDLASADQGFAIKAFPGVGGMQQPLIAISHEDYSEDLLANFMKAPTEDNDSIDLDATELIQPDDRSQSPLYSDQEFSPPIDIIPTRTISNVDTASVASSSADSFIVVQMPDSFDPDRPIYLSQGNEIVPANIVPDANKEQMYESSNEFSSLENFSAPILASTSPTFVTHSPQPNVNVTSLSSISPMSSLKSFVSSVVDKLDVSLTRSLTPKGQLQEDLVSSCEDFKPFEIDFFSQTSVTSDTQDVYTAPPVETSISFDFSSAPPESSLDLAPPTSEFKFEASTEENFVAPCANNSTPFQAKPLLAEEANTWLSQSGESIEESNESTAKWIVSNQVFPSFSLPNDEEAWIAPSTNWKPKSANTPSERLMKMGFCNRELNSQLLDKYNGDLQLVIPALLDDSQAAWIRK